MAISFVHFQQRLTAGNKNLPFSVVRKISRAKMSVIRLFAEIVAKMRRLSERCYEDVLVTRRKSSTRNEDIFAQQFCRNLAMHKIKEFVLKMHLYHLLNLV